MASTCGQAARKRWAGFGRSLIWAKLGTDTDACTPSVRFGYRPPFSSATSSNSTYSPKVVVLGLAQRRSVPERLPTSRPTLGVWTGRIPPAATKQPVQKAEDEPSDNQSNQVCETTRAALLGEVQVALRVDLAEERIAERVDEPNGLTRRLHLWTELLVDFRELGIAEHRNLDRVSALAGLES